MKIRVKSEFNLKEGALWSFSIYYYFFKKKEIGKFFRARNPSSRIFSLHRLLPLVVISPYLSFILFRSPSLSITIAKLHIRSLTSREHHHCHRAIVVLLTLYHILKCHAITQPTEDQVSHGVHVSFKSTT